MPVQMQRQAEEREGLILQRCYEKQYIMRRDVETLFELSEPAAVVILRKMVEKGLLKRIGRGNRVIYLPGPATQDPSPQWTATVSAASASRNMR